MKKVAVVFILILGFAFWQTGIVFGDGMVLPPPGDFIQETDQKAVIFYEDGVERLVIQIAFQGDAEEFAWIVPTPAKPDITKSTDTLFTSLEDLTGESPQIRRPASLETDAMKEQSGGVTVIEEKQIDYYDIAVLEASDKDALYNWLNDNGYSFPSSGKQIADEYIQNGWYFTAMKISQNKDLLAQGQLASGHSTPLMLSFETDRIVYPLKISSISGAEDNAPEGEIMYIDGQEGKAAHIDSDRMVATDKIFDNLDLDQGHLSFYLKKRNSDPVKEIISIQTSNIEGQAGPSVTVNNRMENVFYINITDNYREVFKVDLGSDFKENEWQKYEVSWSDNQKGKKEVEIAIDEKTRSVDLESSFLNSSFVRGEEGRVAIGGQYFDKPRQQGRTRSSSGEIIPGGTFNYSVYRESDLLVDEISVSLGVGSGEEMFKASFEENRKIQANGEERELIVFQEDYPVALSRSSKVNQSGVLLYIFSDKMQKIPGFQNTYSSWLTGEQVENLARVEGGNKPWTETSKDKYFLTKLYQAMSQDEMTEDLYPQEMETPGFTSTHTKMIWVIVLIAGSVLVTAGAIFVMMKENKRH